jgi:hypothetical protein
MPMSITEMVYAFFKRNGWGQEYHHRDACYCLSGAAAAVTVDGFEEDSHSSLSSSGRVARTMLAKELGFRDRDEMETWNDTKDRTKAEVMEQLRRAILKQKRAA